MRNRFLNILFITTISAICLAWGNAGHYKINSKAALSFNQEMNQFQEWYTTLANWASEADYRKNTDPNESPKHYIDIDNYPEFNSTGRIPQTLDSAIMIHGAGFVYGQGVFNEANFTTIILEQNIPNPFQNSTSISIILAEKSKVHLQIFNLAGKRVATLIDERLDQGKHKITWDPQNLPGGVYCLVLTSNEVKATRKMVLMD